MAAKGSRYLITTQFKGWEHRTTENLSVGLDMLSTIWHPLCQRSSNQARYYYGFLEHWPDNYHLFWNQKHLFFTKHGEEASTNRKQGETHSSAKVPEAQSVVSEEQHSVMHKDLWMQLVDCFMYLSSTTFQLSQFLGYLLFLREKPHTEKLVKTEGKENVLLNIRRTIREGGTIHSE